MSAWVEINASHCHVARAIRDQQAEARCVTGIELELLRVALLHWRMKLTDRLCRGIESNYAVIAQRDLIARHGAVLRGALDGVEVPASE